LKSKNFNGKLSHRFLLWFGLALLGPALLLMYFLQSSWSDRQELLVRDIKQHHKRQLSQYQSYYMNKFKPSFHEATMVAYDHMGKEFERVRQALGMQVDEFYQRPKENFELYLQSFHGKMGFMPRPSEKDLPRVDRFFPVRVQVLLNTYGNGWVDQLDLMANIPDLARVRQHFEVFFREYEEARIKGENEDEKLSRLNDLTELYFIYEVLGWKAGIRERLKTLLEKTSQVHSRDFFDFDKLYLNSPFVEQKMMSIRSILNQQRVLDSDSMRRLREIFFELEQYRIQFLERVLEIRSNYDSQNEYEKAPVNQSVDLEELRLLFSPFSTTSRWEAIDRLLQRMANNNSLRSDEWADLARLCDMYDAPLYEFFQFINAKWDKYMEQIRFDRDVSSQTYVIGFLREYDKVRDDKDWSSLKLILRHLTRVLYLGDLAMNPENKMGIKLATGLELELGGFHEIISGDRRLRIYFNVFPSHYPMREFSAGIAPIPRLLGVVGTKQVELQDFYLSLLQIMNKNKEALQSSSTFFQDLEKLWKTDSTITRDLKVSFRPSSASESFKKLIRDLFLSLVNDGNTKAEKAPGLVHYLFNSLRFYLSWEERDRFSLKNQIQSAQSFTSVDIRFKGVTRSDKESKNVIASLLRVPEFSRHEFELKTPLEVINAPLNALWFTLCILFFLGLLISVAMGARLARDLVQPLVAITHSMDQYTKGLGFKSSAIDRREDELGDLFRAFKFMVRRIQERIREMESIKSLTEHTLEDESYDLVLAQACDSLSEHFNASVVFIGFFEFQSREKLLVSSVKSLREKLKESFESRVIHIARNCEEPLELSVEQAISLGLKNAIVLPLRPPEVEVRENLDIAIEGFLFLGNLMDVRFKEEQNNYLQSYLAQVATLVNKLYLDKIKQDNVEGRSIQKDLLPSKIPDMEGRIELSYSFEAARFLGGDFLDFYELDDSLVVLTMADVSGKGIGPALFGASCKAYLKYCSHNFDPSETITNANLALCEMNNANLFATVFLMILDSRTGLARFSSAGHNQMLVFRNESQEFEELHGKGLPLGMFEGGVYSLESVQLNPGDIVILYTDGVNELEDPMLNLYGLEPLQELIKTYQRKSVQEIRDILNFDLDGHRQGRDPSDDISYLIVRYIGPDGVDFESDDEDFSL